MTEKLTRLLDNCHVLGLRNPSGGWPAPITASSRCHEKYVTRYTLHVTRYTLHVTAPDTPRYPLHGSEQMLIIQVSLLHAAASNLKDVILVHADRRRVAAVRHDTLT